LIYNISTLPGMSGGPILDDQGNLIGIHGRGDRADDVTVLLQSSEVNPEVVVKSGFNYGIPIHTIQKYSSTKQLGLAKSIPKTPVAQLPNKPPKKTPPKKTQKLPSESLFSSFGEQTAQLNSISSQVSFLNGTWEGTYICLNTHRKMRLVINAKSASDIDAIFLFTDPAAYGTPSGSFRMKGYLRTFNSPDIPDLIDLQGTEWINRPSGYTLVHLQGNILPLQQRIQGNNLHPQCSTFEVIKKR
jgi:hypothetical protein